MRIVLRFFAKKIFFHLTTKAGQNKKPAFDAGDRAAMGLRRIKSGPLDSGLGTRRLIALTA